MRVVFIGPPGSGKGTQSQRLIGLLDVPHISSGELIREAMRTGTAEGLAAERYMQSGHLVPDPIIIEMLGRRLTEHDCRQGFLLDGFPRTVPQAETLDRDLTARGTPLDGVLELRVDAEALVKRLAGRGRVDDDPTVIRQRMRTYGERTEPLVDYYRRHQRLATIDGMGTPDEVFAAIRTAIDDFARRGRGARSTPARA